MAPLLSEELIEKVRKYFDLNLYEAKAWLILAQRKIASASVISKLAQIPKSRIYDVLESLETRGFVDKLSVKPLKYEVASLSDIVERTKRGYQEEAEKKINELEKFTKTQDFAKIKELEKTVVEENETAPKLYEGESSILKVNKHLSEANSLTIISPYSKIEERIKSISRAIKKAKSAGAKVNAFIYKDKPIQNKLDFETKDTNIDLGDLIIKDGKEVFLFSKGNRVLHIKDEYLASRFLELAKAHSK